MQLLDNHQETKPKKRVFAMAGFSLSKYVKKFCALLVIMPIIALTGCGQGDGPVGIKNTAAPPQDPLPAGFCDPINFEEACPNRIASLTEFEGGPITAPFDNRHVDANNDSAKVARMQKFQAESGATFGGGTMNLTAPFVVAAGSSFTMNVWSPRPVPVQFQAGIATVDVNHGGTGWEVLTFDLGGAAGNVDSISIIFDNGTNGNAGVDPDNWTFYFDDITLVPPSGAGVPIDPEVSLYDPPEAPDLDAELTGFSSQSVINEMFADDTTYGEVLAVSSGVGSGANVAMVGFIGFDPGFMTFYQSLNFKVKGMPGFEIFVSLYDGGNPLRINLTSSGLSGALGDGWYQVSIPLSSFTGLTTATGIVFESNDTAPMQFTMLLNDIGFSGTVDNGGGDTGGGDTGGGDTGGGDTGGIDGRGTPVFAQGSITGFGSIIVNGVKYETEGTEFEIDGETGTEAELEIGDVVLISGTVNDDGISGTATTVTFDDVVEGPVTAKSPDLLQLTVLGQTVQVVDGETLFDDTPPVTFDSIMVGDVIEVSGFWLADGTVSATRIEGKLPGGEYEVTGVVSNLSGTTFSIEDLTVDFSAAALDNFPNGSPENGQPVEAKGMSLGANGELLATRVEYKGNVLGDASGTYVELEGYITRFGSAADFDVSGLPVITTSSTVFEGGTSADLNLNLKVEVDGNVNSNGVLVAEKVEIKTATGIRVVGLVGSISPLEVFGIQINADDLTTRFDDKAGDNPLDNMKLADLRVGDYVEVRGQEQPLGQITAFDIERDDIEDRRELRGFVTLKSQPNLTVLGVTIVTTGTTVYRDSRGATEVPISSADFWAAVQEGSRVDAQGTETDTTTLTATEVELQGD